MEEIKSKIKSLAARHKNFNEICEELSLKDYELIGLIELMKSDGELVDYHNGEIVKLAKPVKTNDIYELKNKLTKLKLLLISDTHLCSNYDRVDILRYLYD